MFRRDQVQINPRTTFIHTWGKLWLSVTRERGSGVFAEVALLHVLTLINLFQLVERFEDISGKLFRNRKLRHTTIIN